MATKNNEIFCLVVGTQVNKRIHFGLTHFYEKCLRKWLGKQKNHKFDQCYQSHKGFSLLIEEYKQKLQICKIIDNGLKELVILAGVSYCIFPDQSHACILSIAGVEREHWGVRGGIVSARTRQPRTARMWWGCVRVARYR